MADATAKKEGEGDLAVLFPDQQATIAGRKITMREYRFVEAMRLQHLISPIVESLVGVALGDAMTFLDAIRPVFANNVDAVISLTAIACDQPEEWVAGLGDTDGADLQLLWWSVNAHFFGRRVREAIVVDQLMAAGRMPSPPSPDPASIPATSSSTPAAS